MRILRDDTGNSPGECRLGLLYRFLLLALGKAGIGFPLRRLFRPAIPFVFNRLSQSQGQIFIAVHDGGVVLLEHGFQVDRLGGAGPLARFVVRLDKWLFESSKPCFQ